MSVKFGCISGHYVNVHTGRPLAEYQAARQCNLLEIENKGSTILQCHVLPDIAHTKISTTPCMARWLDYARNTGGFSLTVLDDLCRKFKGSCKRHSSWRSWGSMQ